MRDGSLRVIDCYFSGNEGALIGPGAFQMLIRQSRFSSFETMSSPPPPIGTRRQINVWLIAHEGGSGSNDSWLKLLSTDVGGGAIYITGSNNSFIVGSTFVNNRASNAGAVGFLQVYNI